MGVEVEANNDNTNFTSEMEDDKIVDLEEKVDDLVKNSAKPKEGNKFAAPNLPKDAVVDWPAPKKIHTFYLIKVRSYEDPELKAKIEQADKDLQRKNQTRTQILDSVKAKRAEKSNLKSQLQPFIAERKKYNEAMNEKINEIKPLRENLYKIRDANNAARERSMGLCSSEEELNDLIKSLHYQIQHESNTLNEEKKLLKEIKQLEATREKVIANAALRDEIEGSKSQKAALQDKVKLLGGNVDEVRKERDAVNNSIQQIDDQLKIVDKELSSLEAELKAAIERRDKAYETLSSLRKARDEMNACFYQNRSLLNNANELAAKKDAPALESLSNSEVEKFMSKWNTSKVFRDDYERRILNSLNYRQLSRDGRMRNTDEKPIITETPQQAKVEISSNKVNPIQSVTASVTPPVTKDVPDNITKTKETKKPTKSADRENVKNIEVEEIGLSLDAPKPEPVDPEKLKQIKREEEIAKNKLALERKKKQQEKAAAKAAAKAQKEAEKKRKKEEKKAKKKAGVTESDPVAEQTEAKTNTEEAEMEADAKPNRNQTLEESEEQKGTSKDQKARYRKPVVQSKVKPQLPRAILKKKKSQKYMYWAIPAAVLAAVLVIFVGLYSSGKI